MDKYGYRVPFGYHGQVLHVDLGLRAYDTEVMDDGWYRTYAGGGLMGMYFLLRDTQKGIDALGESNLLVFVSSVIAGYDAPGLAQFSIVSRSPISGGVAEAPCEGPFGHYLKRSGYDAIIFHGKSEAPVSLIIDDSVPRLVDARWVWGKSPIECARLYSKAYDARDDAVVSIGQAGENMVSFASVVSGSGNQASRMGVGAVMGSKNLKALVVRGGKRPKLFAPEKFAAISKSWSLSILPNVKDEQKLPPPGSLDDTPIEAQGQGTSVKEVHSSYLGQCQCPACPGDCVTRIGWGETPLAATSLNQWITGPLLNNMNYDLYLRANELCNCYGIDTVSVKHIIKLLDGCVKNGLIGKELEELDYCGRASILPLIALITERKGIGDVLAKGRRPAAEILGAVELERGIDGGVSTRAARRVPDLEPGYGSEEDNAAQLRAHVRIMHELHTLWGTMGALNMCAFACHMMNVGPKQIGELVSAVTGWNVSAKEVTDWGERRNLINRMYSIREGCADTLPARFFERPDDDAYGYKTAEALYCELSGFDENGAPREPTLKKHGLEWLNSFLL